VPQDEDRSVSLDWEQAKLDAEQAALYEREMREKVEALPDYRGTITTAEIEIVAPVGSQFMGLQINFSDVPGEVRAYVDAIEAQPKAFCSCLWVDKEHPQRGIVPTRIDEDGECILHSRVGLIQGFFVWLNRRSQDAITEAEANGVFEEAMNDGNSA
jgi:hypothetical protein